MTQSMKDHRLISQITEDMALRYVEDHEAECAVMRHELGGNGVTTMIDSERLCRVWGAINSYDAGKMCKRWLASSDCHKTLRDVVEEMKQMGMKPHTCFIDSAE